LGLAIRVISVADVNNDVGFRDFFESGAEGDDEVSR
jgi:hypothetical protein